MEEYFLLPACESSNKLSCLWEMCKDNELCDVRLIVDSNERPLPVHKCVLAATSPYFKAMFTNDLAESSQNKVRIVGVEYEIMKAVISYAYSVETTVSNKSVLDLLIAADLFQIDSLLCHCSKYLQNQLTPQNVLSTRTYANLYRCWDLYRQCNDYILRNFCCIAETEEFLEIPPEDVKDIIANDGLRVKCEEEVFTAVKRWTYHDLAIRSCAFPSLMQYVRLPLVSQRFLTMEVQNEQLMLDCQKYFSEAVFYKNSPEKRVQLKNSIRIQPRKLYGLNEVMIAIGGTNKTGSIASIDQYDCRMDTWSTLTSSPAPRYGAGACFVNDSIYITGGSNEAERFINRTDVYNMMEKKWTQAADLLIARRYHVMVVLFGLPTVVGGQTIDGVINTIESYHTSSKTWIPGLSINTPRMYHSAVQLNGCIYVMGGHSGIKRLATVECLRLSEWVFVASLPEPRSVLAAVVFTGGIYVAGGYNGEKHVNTVNYYDPISDNWTVCQSMMIGRSAFGLVAYDGSLYACGGFNGTLTNTVETFTPGDNKWQTSIGMNNDRIHFNMITT